MLTCYFDEAGGAEHKFIVVAGYVSSVAQWLVFESDWKILLAKYQVPYLHMKEFAHFKGPFKKWEHQPGTRAHFLRTAADIINSNVNFGISVCVYYKDFEDAGNEFDLPSLFRSPYALAGRSCIMEANVVRGRTTTDSLDMEYIFEKGGPDAAGLVNAVRKITPTLPAPIFKPSRDTKSETGVIQLQAADYLAYEIRKYVKDHSAYKRGERFPRASLGALTATDVHRRFWNLERLLPLCGRLGLKKKTR